MGSVPDYNLSYTFSNCKKSEPPFASIICKNEYPPFSYCPESMNNPACIKRELLGNRTVIE
jgi:hypothetical protein